MTWAEFGAARRLLVEERVGKHVRAAALAEDAKFTATAQAIQKRERR
jgi:hypothetical protein